MSYDDDEPDCTRKGKRWVSFIIKPHRKIRKIKRVKIQ